MSLFDFFNRNATIEDNHDRNNERLDFNARKEAFNVTDKPKSAPVTVFHPHSFKDVETIIDTLKDNKQVLVYLNELTERTQYRVLDMLSGAIYALNGGVFEVQKGIFMFTPNGISVK